MFFRYIYTDNINLSSFELVCDICYAAKKYMLPALVEECTKFLWRDLYPRNACRAYEFAQLFDENVLMDKGLQVCKLLLHSCLCNTYVKTCHILGAFDSNLPSLSIIIFLLVINLGHKPTGTVTFIHFTI